MNVSIFSQKDYENKTLGGSRKNKPNSNPIQTQTNPIKANKMPKQSQYKPKQSQFQRQKNAPLHLFAVRGRTGKIKYEFKTARMGGNES